ncbi:MAG: ThuA domain-containing protein [Bryobacteraceae bacterium]
MAPGVWLLLLMIFLPQAADCRPRKIVLIAGKKSHGPGVHEYVKSVKLLKVMLDRSNLKGVRTEIHFNGWPEDAKTLEDADTIVMISDGQDGELYSPVPFMTEERMQVMARQMKRGCGLVTFHFSTFSPDKYSAQMLDWVGGYFDWQDDSGARKWYSAIKTLDTEVEPATPNHPILRGFTPLAYKEEFYYNIRFLEPDPRLNPILRVPALPGTAAQQTVAWAVERADKGRGFATTTGHAYSNWQNDSYRRVILNAIAWTAGLRFRVRV